MGKSSTRSEAGGADSAEDAASRTLPSNPNHGRDTFSPAQVASHEPPEALEGFTVGEVVGAGGMGVVRSAVQQSLGRTVAIKAAHSGAGADAGRMRQEAWVIGHLEHPGVVPIYDLRETSAGPVVVMRRIQGVSWSQLRVDPTWAQAQGARDLLEQNLRTFIRVCEIVEFAHAKGVMHRDLKPGNVMVGSFGEVYLLDWGLALALDPVTGQHLPLASQAQEVAGTLVYAAPEMVLPGEDQLGAHTDIYLLGAVLFELASGRSPHGERTLESIAASPPPIPPGVPLRVAAICTRAMARRPEDRQPTVAVVRREVIDFLRLRDSEHLVAQAQVALDALQRECTVSGERRRISDRYAECRFAFRESLRSWPDNEAASAGLAAAATAVITWELARQPTVAAALLDEAPPLDPEFTARVKAAAAAEAAQQEALSRLARAHDARLGLDVRRVFFTLLGLGWAVSQYAGSLGAPLTHLRFGVVSLLQLLLLVPLWLLFPSGMKSPFNRRVLGVAALLLAGQAGLFFSASVLGLPVAAARTLQLGVWAIIVAMASISIEPRLWWTTATVVAALAVTLRWPELRAPAGAVCALTMTANMLVIWKRK